MSRKYPPTHVRHPSRRADRAASQKNGWFNWYVDHGRLPVPRGRSDKVTHRLLARELRMISHRRP